MAPPSSVQLCNRALARLGESPVESIEAPTTDIGAQCALIYDDAVLELLAAHPWNFAVTRQELVVLPDEPVFDWSYAFQLPTDPPCLRALDTSSDLSWGSNVPWPPPTSGLWQIERQGADTVLMADENPMSLRYIAAITDPVKFSPHFRAALVAELAYQMAYAVTEKADMLDLWERRAKVALAKAKTLDGQEGRAGSYLSTALIDVRF